MEKITHRTVETNGIKLHIAEQGTGPIVLFVHGFPSLWFSWRFQIPFFAEAGYHAVAPDLRGYGESDIPVDNSKYTMLHHAGDIIGLINELGAKQVFLVGHDWGSHVVSTVALLRPDLIRGLVNLSVPFSPRPAKCDLLTALKAAFGEGFYMNRWQTSENGEAEADFAKYGMKQGLQKIYTHHTPKPIVAAKGQTVLESVKLPDPLPKWLTDEDLQYFADSFEKTGLTGAFNMYRSIASTWELLAPWTNQGLKTVTLFVTGDEDLCRGLTPPGYIEGPGLKYCVPKLTEAIILPGVGHFCAEEAPDKVNQCMLKFFQAI